MNTPQTATCPCCQNVFDSHDQPDEYARVTKWSAARELGKLNKGHRKSLTPEQRQAKAQVLARNRKHRHKAMSSTDHCFMGPVAEPANVAAHGNICRIEVCKCGVTRRTNINQNHKEQGRWEPQG